MALAAITPCAPTLNFSRPKSLLNSKTSGLSVKLANNGNAQRVSFRHTSISWSKAGGRSRTPRIVSYANVSCAVFDESLSEDDRKIDGSEVAEAQAAEVINWGLLWKLVWLQKWRVLLSGFALLGCTTSSLAIPTYSGRFFDVLIGARPESMWQLLSKLGILYTLEPIFTIIFVRNMNCIWEKVMSSLRAKIFQMVLIQKMEFFDRYKVGELTGLLTSDLGSLKNVVSDNISRDRGFRAISEVIGTLCLLFALSIQLAPILGLLMLTVSVLVGKRFLLGSVNCFLLSGEWLLYLQTVFLAWTP